MGIELEFDIEPLTFEEQYELYERGKVLLVDEESGMVYIQHPEQKVIGILGAKDIADCVSHDVKLELGLVTRPLSTERDDHLEAMAAALEPIMSEAEAQALYETAPTQSCCDRAVAEHGFATEPHRQLLSEAAQVIKSMAVRLPYFTQREWDLYDEIQSFLNGAQEGR